uniref:UBIQUITIN_CONJUGAT_2 domain-containing protein n=1 Tax=Parastrongyloides trichosuri TaxID=131310 RepID=A0A0N4ZX84_PARTI
MACIKKLKEDINLIKNLFPQNHNSITITEATLDLVKINFHFPGDAVFEVQCNILENYPRTPSIWCTEHEDQVVFSILAELSEAKSNYMLCPQLSTLINQYCSLKKFEAPIELSQLSLPIGSLEECDEGQGSEISIEEGALDNSDMEEDMDEDNVDEEEDGDYELFDDMDEETEMEEPSSSTDKGAIAAKDKEVLVKLRHKAREDRISNKPIAGSTTATDRLMKELMDVYKSESYKNDTFSVELEDDNLYKWNITLKSVDNESPLYEDLKKLKEIRGESGILLKAIFKEDYPMSPPFIYVHSPQMTNGYVLGGGAICMELLTSQGWSSAYNMESVILQIAATLVKGKGRINFTNVATYNHAKAKAYHEQLTKFHKSTGWFTPPKADG